MVLTVNGRVAPDNDFAGHPANLKSGYPVGAGYWISGWIL
jgi:hypothetical protein